jgi:cytoskeletal protein CcmA (bactofilin family)
MFLKARKPEAKLRSQAKKAPDKPKIPSIISEELHIFGNMKTDGDVQIDGVVDGDVESDLLTIGDSAVVNGNVVGEIIRVAGTVNGEITGRVVELTRTARITGDINHYSLAIEAGAFVQGLCRRIEPKQIESRPVLEATKPNVVVARADSKTDETGKSDKRLVTPRVPPVNVS